jgi:membrane associated rhomboid family serine protease
MYLPAIVFAAAIIYLIPKEERIRLLRSAVALLKNARQAATRPHPESEHFHALLRKRERHAIVTTVLAALNIVVFIGAALGAGRIGDEATLLAWGASVGPRTTNGEWWRLIASTFVHSSVFTLSINIALLVRVGFIVERLVGRVLFAAVYLAAGVFANLAALAAYPIDVSNGASASIGGVIGLLLAAAMWLHRDRSEARLPPIVIARLGAAIALFALWNAFAGDMPLRAETSGFITGLVAGLVLTARVHRAYPAPRRIAGAAALASLLAVAYALPVRGIADVRPEVGALAALEQRTEALYAGAADRFKKGRISSEALAQTIAGAIVPQLQAADAHLQSVRRVPSIHEGLVADARDYLRLRTQSWQLRAEGLRTIGRAPAVASSFGDPVVSARGRERITASYRASTMTLAKAEAAERASLAALERTRRDIDGPARQPEPRDTATGR